MRDLSGIYVGFIKDQCGINAGLKWDWFSIYMGEAHKWLKGNNNKCYKEAKNIKKQMREICGIS